MCQSKAEGGRRCAAHTRPRYQAATFGTAAWDAAAADYAATREGDGVLTDALVQAQARGDIEREIGIETALAAGARQRQITNATQEEIRDAEKEALRAQIRDHAMFDLSCCERHIFEPVLVELPDGNACSVAVHKMWVDQMRSDDYYFQVNTNYANGPHVTYSQGGSKSAMLTHRRSTREEINAEAEQIQKMAVQRVEEVRRMKTVPTWETVKRMPNGG